MNQGQLAGRLAAADHMPDAAVLVQQQTLPLQRLKIQVLPAAGRTVQTSGPDLLQYAGVQIVLRSAQHQQPPDLRGGYLQEIISQHNRLGIMRFPERLGQRPQFL